MNTLNKFISPVAIFLSLLAIALTQIKDRSFSNTAYINVQEAINAFDLKKEKEAEFNNHEASNKIILDSLKLHLQIRYESQADKSDVAKSKTDNLELLQRQYKIRENQINLENSTLSQKLTEQVITQFNQYVHDFGIENNYTYIYGANSSGTLMFADDSRNITKEIIEYINLRYQGKN